jgi:hypothetical protein
MSGQIEEKHAQGVRSSTGQAAPSQTDSRLLPAFADLQRQMMATVKGEATRDVQEVHEALAPDGYQASSESEGAGSAGQQGQPSNGYPGTPGLTLTIGRQDVDRGCRTVLSGLVDALFSDAQRTVVQTQSDEMLRALVATVRKARPDAAAMKEARHEAERILGDMYDSLFSDEVRTQTLYDGEQVVQALLQGNIPAARRKGEHALVSLTERRGAVLKCHWEQVFRSLVNVMVSASKEEGATRSERDSGSKTASRDGTTMPQTIARSDKRAQDIWTRAYTRAANEHGEGGRAQRAAYDSLRAEYEKKGDRWVKISR